MSEKNYLKYIALLEEQVKGLELINMDDSVRKEYIDRNKLLIKYYSNKIKSLKHEIIGNTFESGVDVGESVENKNVDTSTV
jgi:hypothetical protein